MKLLGNSNSQIIDGFTDLLEEIEIGNDNYIPEYVFTNLKKLIISNKSYYYTINSEHFPKLNTLVITCDFNNYDNYITGSFQNLEELVFKDDARFDREIKTGTFPNLKKITFGFKFNSNIEEDSMPLVEDIIFPFNSFFNKTLNTVPKLKKVTLGSSFKQPLIKDLVPDIESVFYYKTHDGPGEIFNRENNLFNEEYAHIIGDLRPLLKINQTGGKYYKKYLKYKQKYLTLKNA